MNQTVLDVPLSDDVRRENALDGSLSPGQGTPFHLGWFGFGSVVPSCKLAGAAKSILLLTCLLLCLGGSALAFPFVSRDGKRVEIASLLPKDQDTIVFFHAPWSKTSSRYQVELTAWEKKQSKIAILGVEVKNLEVPVAKQYNVTSVPWFLIYNEKGELTHQGQPALNEVLKLMKP